MFVFDDRRRILNRQHQPLLPRPFQLLAEMDLHRLPVGGDLVDPMGYEKNEWMILLILFHRPFGNFKTPKHARNHTE